MSLFWPLVASSAGDNVIDPDEKNRFPVPVKIYGSAETHAGRLAHQAQRQARIEFTNPAGRHRCFCPGPRGRGDLVADTAQSHRGTHGHRAGNRWQQQRRADGVECVGLRHSTAGGDGFLQSHRQSSRGAYRGGHESEGRPGSGAAGRYEHQDQPGRGAGPVGIGQGGAG